MKSLSVNWSLLDFYHHIGTQSSGLLRQTWIIEGISHNSMERGTVQHWHGARSIRPKIPVWISEIFVCQMERYFPPGRTDLVLFPLEHISHQEFGTRQNAEGSWWSGCLKCRKLLHVERFNTHSEFNSSLILTSPTQAYDERNLRTFLAGEYANRVNWPTGNSERSVQNFPGNNIQTFLWRIGDQEQGRTVADHFASRVVSTRKTCRHFEAFHDSKELGPIYTG